MIHDNVPYEQQINALLESVNSSNYLKTGYQLGRIFSRMTSGSFLDTEGCKKIAKNVHALLQKIEECKKNDCGRKGMSKVQSIVNTILYRSVKSTIHLVNKRLAYLVDVALKNEEKSSVIDKKSNPPSFSNENIQQGNLNFIQSLMKHDETRLVRELLMLSPNRYGQLKIWLEQQSKNNQNMNLSQACKKADILIQKAREKRVARRKIDLLSEILYKPAVSEEKKQEIRAKFRNVSEKIKIIGKGSLNKNAKILDPAYWVETLTFGKEKFHVYQNFLAPYKEEWDLGLNDEGEKWSAIMTFQDFFNSKIDQMDSAKLAELEKNKVKYNQDEQKLRDLRVSFSDGKIMQNNKTVANGQYMFVLSPDGKNLYLAPKEKGIFHHSSFLSGGAVKSAGMVYVKNGKVDIIYKHSGHYKPTKQQMNEINVYLSDRGRMGDFAKNIRYAGGVAHKLNMFKIWIKSKIGHP